MAARDQPDQTSQHASDDATEATAATTAVAEQGMASVAKTNVEGATEDSRNGSNSSRQGDSVLTPRSTITKDKSGTDLANATSNTGDKMDAPEEADTVAGREEEPPLPVVDEGQTLPDQKPSTQSVMYRIQFTDHGYRQSPLRFIESDSPFDVAVKDDKPIPEQELKPMPAMTFVTNVKANNLLHQRNNARSPSRTAEDHHDQSSALKTRTNHSPSSPRGRPRESSSRDRPQKSNDHENRKGGASPDDNAPEDQPLLGKLWTLVQHLPKLQRYLNRGLDTPASPALWPKSLKDIEITAVESEALWLDSAPLLRAIRHVVPEYFEFSLAGDRADIFEPYEPLLQYLAELKEHLETLRGKLKETRKSSIGKSEVIDGVNDKREAAVNADSVRQKLSASDHTHDRSDVDPGVKSERASEERIPATTYTEENIRDFEALIGFLDTQREKHLAPLDNMLARPTPVITFLGLWRLFKPGHDVYFYRKGWQDRLAVGVLNNFSHEWFNEDERRRGQRKGLRVHFWALESDGVQIWRTHIESFVAHFKGEKEVTSLAVFPCSYFDATDNGDRRARLETRGALKLELLHARNKQMKWSGTSCFDRSRQYSEETVVCDIESAIVYYDAKEDVDAEQWSFERPEYQSGLLTGDVTDKRWEGYDRIKVAQALSLTKHHEFLMTPFVAVFVLSEKRFRIIDVEELTDIPSQEQGMERLVIDDDSMDILRSAGSGHRVHWTPETIEGKGEGQIVLLHGPPGVGKTFSVELLAQVNRRALLSLTVADIGLKEETIERKLSRWLSLAEKWNAVVLLDEADIFLERRQLGDIQRNGLVSVFLRTMEYFRGLMFLTSNRAGHIDDAFLSRITVVIAYEPLDRERRRKIWQNFFTKLEVDMKKVAADIKATAEQRAASEKADEDIPPRRQGRAKIAFDGREAARVASEKKARDSEKDQHIIRVSKYAKEFILEDKEVQDLEWNGREIRNAFLTAISLARYKAVKENSFDEEGAVSVQPDHFRSVVKMSRMFKSYVNSIEASDESERATTRRDRNDAYWNKRRT